MSDIDLLKNAIRDVPDFPKKGILFKDITTMLSQGPLLRQAVDTMAAHFQNAGITKILCVESRGFIFGAPVAYKLGAGMVPVRKKGKLPSKTISVTYSLEYGTDTLEMHADAIAPGEKVLIVDDLLATGGTAAAVCELVKKAGGTVAGIGFVIELDFLKGRNKIKDCGEIYSLIHF